MTYIRAAFSYLVLENHSPLLIAVYDSRFDEIARVVDDAFYVENVIVGFRLGENQIYGFEIESNVLRESCLSFFKGDQSIIDLLNGNLGDEVVVQLQKTPVEKQCVKIQVVFVLVKLLNQISERVVHGRLVNGFG